MSNPTIIIPDPDFPDIQLKVEKHEGVFRFQIANSDGRGARFMDVPANLAASLAAFLNEGWMNAFEPWVIRTKDAFGNTAFFKRRTTDGTWYFVSAGGTPLAESNWSHSKVVDGVDFPTALRRTTSPEAALKVVKDFYHSGPAKAEAEVV